MEEISQGSQKEMKRKNSKFKKGGSDQGYALEERSPGLFIGGRSLFYEYSKDGKQWVMPRVEGEVGLQGRELLFCSRDCH